MLDRDETQSMSVADGVVVEYSDAEVGDPIVLIHAGGFADWFLPTAQILRSQGHRVIRLRRAGYGDVAPPAGLTIRDHAAHSAVVLERLGVTAAYVVGHSSGAMVALDLAAMRPDLVDRMTLYEPAPGGPLAPPPDEIGAPAPAEPADDPFDSFMTMACGPGYLPILTEALGPVGLARARVEGSYFLSDEFPAAFSWPFDAATATKIRQPLMLAAGDASWPAYRSACDRLQQMIPHASVLTVGGADHMYPLASPDAFAALVIQQDPHPG